MKRTIELVRRGVVIFTFGNVSGISRKDGLVAIKPSGVPYEELTAEQIVVTDLDGRIVDTNLRPSSDLPTHLELYKAFPNIGGVAHTHSEFATAWAQAKRPIPCLGTTHADYFHGPVPVTPDMTPEEIAGEYEKATGEVIVRTFARPRPGRDPGGAGRRPRALRLGQRRRRRGAQRRHPRIHRAHGDPYAGGQSGGAAAGARAPRQALSPQARGRRLLRAAEGLGDAHDGPPRHRLRFAGRADIRQGS